MMEVNLGLRSWQHLTPFPKPAGFHAKGRQVLLG